METISLPFQLFFPKPKVPSISSLLLKGRSQHSFTLPNEHRRRRFLVKLLGSTMRLSQESKIKLSKGTEERIREFLQNEEVVISPSAYDTAWVAMVPSKKFPDAPYFPQCIEWILDNQNPDGSWGISYVHPSLLKDALTSTLACVLALWRWRVGNEHVRRGLHFIGSQFSVAKCDQGCSPVGFNIIFPGMVEFARDMGLELPVCEDDIVYMLHLRDLQMQRGLGDTSERRKAYLAYVAEGLGKFHDWQVIMRYQRSNGSLFNSPSTTAAALIHLKDESAITYLQMLLQKFGSSVPTVYPLGISTSLSVIDHLERLGIAWHFKNEIENILERTYSSWMKNDEEVILDPATCAMAFRLLRMHGYRISPDILAQFDEENTFLSPFNREQTDVHSVMELYKASQVRISSDEHILEKLDKQTSNVLQKETLSSAVIPTQATHEEAKFALRYPFYADLDRLGHKRYIEHSNFEGFCLLKAAYLPVGVKNQDLLELAIDDFSISQSIYLKELKHLERWVEENKLDQLGFARQKLTYCYFSAASTLFIPEMSDARMSLVKNGVLTTVVDDFFDVGGSMEELLNLVALVEKWDENKKDACLSEQVMIVYTALYNTINELGAKASILQKRSVTGHLIEIWLTCLKSMMKEAEWQASKTVPSMDEYMQNGSVSLALGPNILPALYFVGPHLSENVTRNSEYHNLFRLVSICGRLLNDIQGFQREGKEGKLNSVSLYMLHSNGSVSEEEAMTRIRDMIDSARMELLKLVLMNEESVVPRECKDLFWKMSKILHVFYRKNDGYTSPKEMLSSVSAVIYEPLKISSLSHEQASNREDITWHSNFY